MKPTDGLRQVTIRQSNGTWSGLQPIATIQKDDVFKLFESDGEYVGLYQATSPGLGGSVEAYPIEPRHPVILDEKLPFQKKVLS